MCVCVCVLSLGVFHIRRPYILVTEVSSPEGMGDYFSLVFMVYVYVCVRRSAWVCVGLWPMIIFILLRLVWSYVFLDIPSQWLKD